MASLTQRQKQIYDFIRNYIEKKSLSPTFEEIRRHFKLSALSTVHQHIDTLAEKGFLVKTNNIARGIELKEDDDLVTIPLIGTIAAGEPIEAIEDKETIAVPRSRLPKSSEIYALRVAGDSMIDEDINDGDVVIIKKQRVAENGQKVVALLNENEATLKKIYREKGKIRLQPANKNIKPLYVKPGEVMVQGVLIDVVRKQAPTQITPPLTQNKSFAKNKYTEHKKLSYNKIICGDTIETMKKMPSASIDLIIADPPYNLSHGNTWSWRGGNLPGFGGAWNKVMESWDNMSLADYFAFTSAWLSEAKRVLKPTGSIWIFGTYHNIGIINTLFQILDIEIINEVIWYKRNAFPNLSGRRLTASHETLLWGHNGKKKRNYQFNYQVAKAFHDPSDLIKAKDKQMRTVWDIPNNKAKEEIAHGKHPTH